MTNVCCWYCARPLSDALSKFLCVAVVHPVDKNDPYAPQSPVPVDCGFQCRMAAGVMVVYRDENAVERDEPLDMPYPPLREFLADQAVLTRLISDGPL